MPSSGSLKSPLPSQQQISLACRSKFKFPNIYCRCGHGFCEVRTAKNGRSCFVCPIKRGKKCTNFVKWCDDPIDESDLRPPLYEYPTCSCRAGVCRRVKATSGSIKRHFFACPIRPGHGACSYWVREDTLWVIPNIEDLMDTDITPNFDDLQDMDITPEIDNPQDSGIPDIDDPQDPDTPDIDDPQDIDKVISGLWESLEENARSTLQQLKHSTVHDLSPEKHIEGEKVSVANIPDNYVKLEDSYVEAKAELEASQQRCQSLREEASQLKIMLQKLEGKIISCELQTKEMETRLGEIQASMIGG